MKLSLLTQTDEQYPRAYGVRHIMKSQGGACFAFHIAVFQDAADITLGDLVHGLRSFGQFARFEHADHYTGTALFFRACIFYAKFHLLLLNSLCFK